MAVDRNERVMEMVEEALRENPDVSNDELQEQAAEIDPRVGELSPRSFNARYPLQVKRRLAAESEDSAGGSVKGSDETRLRANLRDTLIGFAKDVVAAEDRGDAIDVVRSVDDYVDRVFSGT